MFIEERISQEAEGGNSLDIACKTPKAPLATAASGLIPAHTLEVRQAGVHAHAGTGRDDQGVGLADEVGGVFNRLMDIH